MDRFAHTVGNADRESFEITDALGTRAAGVHLHRSVSVSAILRSRRAVSLSDGTLLPYDRLVLATGARANIPTLDGVTRVRRDRQIPTADAATLDTSNAPLPRGVTVLRDLDEAERVLAAVAAGKRIVVLGAGVLGMEIVLAATAARGEACVVYHGEIPMAPNLDRGGDSVLAQSARRAGGPASPWSTTPAPKACCFIRTTTASIASTH
ncbi:FAD-dependent oxidoreductase [Cryobacterium sp. Y62]|uniref:FAD-dependent oxidoreductase n=1 Tax=Cryobacterium sp. Y62 TaxID=2048284 RepID=UPI000CE354F7